MTDVQDTTEPAREQADRALARFTDGFSWLRRASVWHSPAEHGLAYEDVTFPAQDGVLLEGWYIPAPGSGKLIIANHPTGSDHGHARPRHDAAACQARSWQDEADLIVRNARVTTLQDSSPEAEAFVMRRQKFLAVGTEAETMRLAGDGSRTWRGEGRQRRPRPHPPALKCAVIWPNSGYR